MANESSATRVVSLADVRGQRGDFGPVPPKSERIQSTTAEQPLPEERYLHRILLDRIMFLEREVAEMRQVVQDFVALSEVIELRDVPYEDAKQEVAQYFREHDGDDIGYEELVEALRLDLELVVRICNDLLEEGKIG